MRRMLVAVGSGAIGSNADRLADAFIAGARAAGNKVSRIFPGGNISGCRGCGICRMSGKCSINDDMQAAYPLFDDCDTLVLASPLYFWTLSGQIKLFVDRLYAKSKDDIYPEKDTMLLMTAGDDVDHTFDRAVEYYQFITSALGWHDIGGYIAGGIHAWNAPAGE